MKKLLLIAPLIVSCPATRCSSIPVGPVTPPAPYQPVDDTEVLQETYKAEHNIIQFNPTRFAACAAIEAVYDAINYGIFLPTAALYVPADKPGDRHTIQISCLDEDGALLNTQNITQVHL